MRKEKMSSSMSLVMTGNIVYEVYFVTKGFIDQALLGDFQHAHGKMHTSLPLDVQ